MKLKAAITQGAPQEVVDALGSREFALAFLTQVCDKALGADSPQDRPGEYYVQVPDVTVAVNDKIGVELRLTGLSRGTRTPKKFHHAVEVLHFIAKEALKTAMAAAGYERQIQLFTVLMIDGDVETSPGSGSYSNVLESRAEWVTWHGGAPDAE